MDKENRFTDQAFKKVTDKKAIEEAKRRAEVISSEAPPKKNDKKIS